ncbi:MAG: 8-oxo-dGTP diphosphatase [Candidatus Bipolaricaulia bacterium]
MGFKKVGFGKGKYNGFGGKIEAGETIGAAAVRELEEETGIKVSEKEIQRVALLTFLFPAKPDWDQVVHVFLVKAWDGEPVESTEMKPVWFKVDEIPFEKMWQDDVHWLPLILEGKRVKAIFTFKDDNETIDEFEIEEIEKWSD